MKKKNVSSAVALILLCSNILWSQNATIKATAHTRHNIPTLISVAFPDTTYEWLQSHYNAMSTPEKYTITDSTFNTMFSPDKIEYDTTLNVELPSGKWKATTHLYSLTGYLPDHRYSIVWKDSAGTFSTAGSLIFKDCIQATVSQFTIKPLIQDKSVAVDFKFANNIYGSGDMLVNWTAKGYIDFSNKDSISNAEIKAEYSYPLSSLRPHPFFIGKLGGDLDGHFTTADVKATAGVSILDQFVLPPVLKFIEKNLFNASMPVPPPVLAVFGDAVIPWSREKGFGDSLLWRLAGEIDINMPMGSGNYLNIYMRGWFLKNNDMPSFVEFTYKKEVTRDIAVVLKWLNGSLPPLFLKGSNIMAGVSVAFPGLVQQQ
jgi:hypothetical protein